MAEAEAAAAGGELRLWTEPAVKAEIKIEVKVEEATPAPAAAGPDRPAVPAAGLPAAAATADAPVAEASVPSYFLELERRTPEIFVERHFGEAPRHADRDGRPRQQTATAAAEGGAAKKVVRLEPLRRDLETVCRNAADDGLSAFVVFWHRMDECVRYLSLREFGLQKDQFASIGVVVENSIWKRCSLAGDDTVVEFVLFSQSESTHAHPLALALCNCAIPRTILYCVCRPLAALPKDAQEVLLAKVEATKSQLCSASDELLDALRHQIDEINEGLTND
jgi:hypothetical protein